jgi:hypothetical protein
MNKSAQQLIFLIGGVLVFIMLFSLCNPFEREIMLLEDPHVDQFVQQDVSSQVDILWVVDNSGSMSSSQENLGREFGRFIENFVGKQEELLDFQMAIVTTDPGENGAFFQRKILTRAQALAEPDSFIEDFRELVRVGTNGSGIECGLLSMANATKQIGQQPFFRPDAILVVNILTDEPDKSMQKTGKSVLEFVQETRQFKGHRRLMINTIVDTSGYEMINRIAELNNLYNAITGDKKRWVPAKSRDLIAAAKLTQGLVADIHGDFASSLSRLSQSISELAGSFALTRKADSDLRMMVLVDGEEIDPYYWRFDPGLNAIRFTDEYLPEAGAAIEVHYEVFHDWGPTGLEQESAL